MQNGFNPKDPLPKTLEDSGQELFKRFAQAANGFPVDAVLSAAINLLINVLRQNLAKRVEAEAKFNELFGRTKQVLLDMYDPTSGNRRNIFPFTQHIHAAHVKDTDDIKGI